VCPPEENWQACFTDVEKTLQSKRYSYPSSVFDARLPAGWPRVLAAVKFFISKIQYIQDLEIISQLNN
jgi:hypothetical protein